MNRYAVIVDSIVVNVIVWDGVTEFDPDDGRVVRIPDELPVGIGWQRANRTWIAPPEPEAEEIT